VSLAHDFYQAGGWTMHLILLVGIGAAALAILLPIVAYASRERRPAVLFTVVLVAVGLGAVLLGILGQALGLRSLARALAAVDPADREVIGMVGVAEARTCLAFGLFAAILPWTAAALTLGRAATSRVSGRAVLGGVALAAAVWAVAGGLARQQLTLFERDRSAGLVAPEQRAFLLQEGSARARAQQGWGLGAGGVLAVVGAVLLTAGRAARRGDPA
jgi:hypothetical protein